MSALNDKKLTFALLCLANITISFNFAALAAVVPAISRDLMLPDVQVSRILHYYMIPYGLGAMIYAPLARRINYRNILIGSVSLYSAMNWICAAQDSLPIILLARIFMGLAAAAIVPLTLIVMGKGFEKQIRGRLVGMFFSTSFIASLFGLFLSGMAHWRWLFYIPLFLGVVNIILIAFVGSSILRAKETVSINYFKVFRQPRIRRILGFIFVISFLYHGVHKWFGVYLDREYHLHQGLISFFFILIALFGVFGQNLGGWLTDHKGRFNACQIGVSILALATMSLYGHYPLFVLGMIFAAFSIGWTIGHNGVSTVLTDMPEETRSEIASLNSFIRFFSGGLGFFVGGPFVEKNFGMAFLCFGILMFLSSLFLEKIIPQEASPAAEKSFVAES